MKVMSGIGAVSPLCLAGVTLDSFFFFFFTKQLTYARQTPWGQAGDGVQQHSFEEGTLSFVIAVAHYLGPR